MEQSDMASLDYNNQSNISRVNTVMLVFVQCCKPERCGRTGAFSGFGLLRPPQSSNLGPRHSPEILAYNHYNHHVANPLLGDRLH